MKAFQPWIKGLTSAFIAGAANAVTNVLVAPETFNFHDGINKLWQAAAASGLVAACFYLKQSPIPTPQPETPKQ